MQPQLIGGRYRVQTAIGQGGMGTVWLCRDEKLARDVAVKQVGLLPGESVTDSARALREARSSAALSHRNVVTVFDVVEQDRHIWMVMENVPSRALSDIIRDEGALPPERVAAIGAQAAEGLAAAHAAGITHRDVKPGNVLVREDGVAKISDFGIARTAGDPALTQTGLFIGTPMYFSPELARGAEPAPAADVWALGATLYAAVEGRPPYEQKTNAVAVISEIANEHPQPPQRAGALTPVLNRMLDRDPATRWSMADAAHALHRIAAQQSDQTRSATTAALAAEASTDTVAKPTTTPRPASSAPPARTPQRDMAPARSRTRGPVYAAIAVVALLLIGGLAYLATNQGDAGGTPAASDGSPRDSGSTGSEPTSPSASPESPPDTGARAAQVAFLKDYFGTVPDDLDTGWSMLGPRMRSVGRDSYESWWGTVETVSVSRITPNPGGGSADVTLRYVMKDGRVSVERQRIDLVRSGDGDYLINGDAPA
ncbi:MAG: serine/threonine-protein kinase [Nocardioides sp.]